MSTLVVGLGDADRGDDGVGVVVAHRLAARGADGIEVAVHHDPASLLDLWAGRDRVVVVDAVRSGAPAGTVHRLLLGAGREPLPASAWAATGRGGTHALGLATAVELARALHRLPTHLVVLGVEAASFGHGEPLSAPVAAAVPAVVEQVLREVREVGDRVPG